MNKIISNYDKNTNDILNFLTSEGMINSDDVQNFMNKIKQKKLLDQHKQKIFQGNDGRWKTHLYVDGKRTLVTRKSLEELNDYIANFYEKLNNNFDVKELNTLEKIFPYWLKFKTTQTSASSYIKRILVDWNKYYKETDIVEIPLTELTYLRLNQWAYDIVKNNSLTRKQYYNMSLIMRQCLDYACEPEIGLLQQNVFNRVRVNKNLFIKTTKPKSNTQVFLVDEQERLSNEAKRKFDARPWCTTPLIILLNFQLGLRIGELCTIKWEDIEGNYIHIQRMEVGEFEYDEKDMKINSRGIVVVPHTKSSAGDRLVYLNSIAKDILRAIKSTNIKYSYYDDGYIYIKSRGGSRGTSRAISEYLVKLCKVSGIAIKSSHKIRKTFISSLFDKGININTIREVAGHESEQTSLKNYCFDSNTDAIIESKLETASNKLMSL